MSQLPTNFADLLAPVSQGEFFDNYHLKTPLHIPGAADRFADLMSWDELSRILGLHGVWTARRLQLALDRRPIATDRYCRTAATLDGPVPMADLARVEAFLAEGASLVLNTLDTLSPQLNQMAGVFEQAFAGTVQSNLYYSSTERQAFDTHFDTHDVFALHTTGTKTWRIYKAHVDGAMAHDAVTLPGPEAAERARAHLDLEVEMKPGDLLYIPRGRYHDALATSDGCIHIAFGIMPMRAADLFVELENIAVADPFFRRDVPTDDAGFAAYLGEWSAAMAKLTADPETVARLLNLRAGRQQARGAITLPPRSRSLLYALKTQGLSVRKVQGCQVITDGKQGTPIPEGTADFISWVLARPSFLAAEAVGAFPHLGEGKVSELLDQLAAMQVIEER